MAVILKLPESTIQLIAAGEIITRPVNIVKELLENSLDAGATNIRVTIEQGGMKLIEIIDNGDGIARTNAEMLCCRYATSKLSSADDLTRISTFGFRGEALASISEMADLEVRTFCRQSDTQGWVAKYKSGKLVEPPVDKYLQFCGTQLRVTNLFASTPRRRSAFKSSFIDEKKAIADLITRYGTHHRDKVTMSLKDGTNDLICLLAPMPLGPCLGMFYGFEMENNLIEFPVVGHDHLKMTAQVAISYKKLSGNSGNFTFILFVNDRLVECNDLKKELEAAVHDHLSMKMYNLLAIVSLRVPSSDVDVNMHPSKATVALHYHVEILQLIVDRLCSELKERLNIASIAPSTPIIEKSVSQLLSQSSKPKQDRRTDSGSSHHTSNHDLNHNDSINHRRLSVLAPASLTTPNKRPHELIHNDSSQKTLAQLASSRRSYRDEVKPWPGFESMARKNVKVSIKSPSPGVETIVYGLDDQGDPDVLPPKRPRRDLKLRSIYELRKLVAAERATESIQVIKNSTFIGIFDHDRALIQCETKLYAINLKSYLKEQYYQFYLFDIGNFPPIQILPPGNKIGFIIEIPLENELKHNPDYYNSLKYKTANDIVTELLKHSNMFEDYFSIKMTSNEILTIPCIMPDEVPNLNYLGRFLIDLANFVDYTNEKECLRTIGRLIANFYAEPPANLKNKTVHRAYHNLIETKLYEAIKRYLLIPEWLLTKENICQISDTKDLYKVFERC